MVTAVSRSTLKLVKAIKFLGAFYRPQDKWLFIVSFLATTGILLYKHLFLVIATGPTIFLDEFLYKDNALRLFTGHLFSRATYPLLYSLILSPAFFFDHWYDVMIAINGLVSSLLLVPVWFLARKFVSPALAMFLVLLTALLPFHVVYPRLVMSENLSMVLFTLAVLFVVDGIRGNKWQAFVFGIVLGLCFITKYVLLPAIPILIVFWFFGNEFGDNPVPVSIRDKIFKVLLLFIGVVLAIIPWVFLVHQSGLPLYKAFGIGISGIDSPEISAISFFRFAVAYIAYILLSVGPMLMPLLLFGISLIRGDIQRRKISRDVAFLLLIIVLTGLYWLVGTQHSFGAVYNYPVPANIQGRYLMYLTPLFIIAGGMTIERISTPIFFWTYKKTMLLTGLVLLFFYGSRWLLYDKNFFGFPPWFATPVFLLPDSFIYGNKVAMYIGLACTIGFGCTIWLLHRKQQFVSYLPILIFLLIWQSVIFKLAVDRVSFLTFGLHSRSLAQILNNISDEGLFNNAIFYKIPRLSSGQVVRGLEFFGITIPPDMVFDLSIENYPLSIRYTDQPFVLVTAIKSNWPLLGMYEIGDADYYVYQIDTVHIPQPEIKILDYKDVDSIVAGEPFNVQPNGKSAFSLKTKNATPTTVVVFDGKELKTIILSPISLVAVLEKQIFLHEKKVEIYLLDRLTGKKSEPITIEIRKY